MNLFSQSKIALKLKKPNNAKNATTSKNKHEEPATSDLLKSENLLNNSVVSENNSFIEILHTAQPCNEIMSISQDIFKSSSDINVTNTIENKPCPVCLQMIDAKNLINHVKSCGTSHNLSPKMLIKAVNLQERQEAERKALGLPKLTNSLDVKKKKKCNVKKQLKLKNGCDSNLDLAIAMSMSLQESKQTDIIKESESLLEAGLEKEAMEKRKTLESFGFISNQPIKFKPKVSKTNSLLFKQTKEDREKRITEKVAMILIDFGNSTSSLEIPVNHCLNQKLESKYLNKIRNFDNKLWKKSLLEEQNESEYYVNNLSQFIRPCESHIFTSLKNFHFPANLQSTSKQTMELSTGKKEITDTLHTDGDNFNLNSIPITSNNVIKNKTMSEYSLKWKSMIGNQFMSDITIFTKDEHEIPAHTLVFHVQCPDILNDIIKEESNVCKMKKSIMWLEFSYEACLAFLELIYTGQESFISPELESDYLQLGVRYNIHMTVNNDEKCRWVSKKQDIVLKRKSTELYKSSTYKRYKASSPDMFMSEDSNFLETKVNDDHSLSMLRTKQWLFNCNIDQQHCDSSFTKNLLNETPRTISPDKSPSHSFHSASTVSFQLGSTSNIINDNVDHKHDHVESNLLTDINSVPPKLLSTDESSLEAELMWCKNKNVRKTSVICSTGMSTLINLHKKPELIIINSDSDNESIDMILCNSSNNFCNNKIKNNSKLLNTNNDLPISQLSRTNENDFSFNKYENNVKTIELDDNSLDSIHTASTNLLFQKNNTKLPHSFLENSSLSYPIKRTLRNTDDERSIFSAVTNVLPVNHSNTQLLSSNSTNIIDLVDNSSSDSVSAVDIKRKDNLMQSVSPFNYTLPNFQNTPSTFSNVTTDKIHFSSRQANLTKQCKTDHLILHSSSFKSEQTLNSSFSNSDGGYSANTNIKNNDNFDFYPSIYSSSNFLPECSSNLKLSKSPNQSFQKKTSSTTSTASHINVSVVEENDDSSNIKFSNKKNFFYNTYLDSKLLENKVKEKSILSSTIYDSNLNTKELFDINSCASSQYINKQTTTNSVNTEVELNSLTETINTSKITIPEQNNHTAGKTNKQIFDDPLMDYDDQQQINISPQYISPVLSENNSIVSVDKSEVQTPKKQNHIVSDIPTPISKYPNEINSQKKNSATPNKYGSRINTPKSLRRVRSESVIVSNEQVTPLPHYSTMKTPDLRKEYDRYGLKDLGRHKGKLLLRHIYDVLHPLNCSQPAKFSTECEVNSDSSDSSEYGIPDNDEEYFDELETFSQTNLSNKTSVEMGFKQLLRVNEEFHKKILCYEPIWIEELKEDLKQYNVTISMQKLMTFLDDKCVTFRSKSLNDQRQKTLGKKNTKRKKLF